MWGKLWSTVTAFRRLHAAVKRAHDSCQNKYVLPSLQGRPGYHVSHRPSSPGTSSYNIPEALRMQALKTILDDGTRYGNVVIAACYVCIPRYILRCVRTSLRSRRCTELNFESHAPVSALSDNAAGPGVRIFTSRQLPHFCRAHRLAAPQTGAAVL